MTRPQPTQKQPNPAVELIPYSRPTPTDPYELIVWHGYNHITCELCQKDVSLIDQVIPCKDCHFYRHVSSGDRMFDSYDGSYLGASLYRISPSGVTHLRLDEPHPWHDPSQAMCGRRPR